MSYPLSNFKYFQILIDGIRGNGYRGDIAIDDLTFTQTKCQIKPSQAVPTTAAPSTTASVSFGVTPRKLCFTCNVTMYNKYKNVQWNLSRETTQMVSKKRLFYILYEEL